MQPLARTLVDGGPLPLMTTGANTRRALRAAGAGAAATGATLHFMAPPDRSPASLEVLGHELSHSGERAPTTRFLLGPLADPGERWARAAGRETRMLAEPGGRPGQELTAAAGRRLDRPTGSLPVAPAGRPAPAAPASAAGRPEHPGGPPTATLKGTRPPPGAPATGPGPAPEEGRPASAGTGETAPAPERAPGMAAGSPADLVAGSSAATDPFSRLGELLELLEERLLAELERRGGRFAGVF